MEKNAILTDWAYDCYEEGTLYALVEDDMEALNDRKIWIGLLWLHFGASMKTRC